MYSFPNIIPFDSCDTVGWVYFSELLQSFNFQLDASYLKCERLFFICFSDSEYTTLCPPTKMTDRQTDTDGNSSIT